MRNIKCPRCGTDNIKEITPSTKHTLKEFACKGICSKDNFNFVDEMSCTYFQYDIQDRTYSWPARAMWQCHEEDVEDVRSGRKKADII